MRLLVTFCSLIILSESVGANEYACDDPRVVERLKVSLTCGVQCIPGLTNEEVKTKSEAEGSRLIEDFLVRQGGRSWWVGGILDYVASVFARGIAEGLADVSGFSAHSIDYDPTFQRYECEADVTFDTQKLTSFEKFYTLKRLMAPEGGTQYTNSFIRRAMEKEPTNPAPIEFYLNTTVAKLMASGFQRALSKIRYSAQPSSSGELVLTLDAAFTQKRILEQSSGPPR
jgi:hypothetical protein